MYGKVLVDNAEDDDVGCRTLGRSASEGAPKVGIRVVRRRLAMRRDIVPVANRKSVGQ